MSWKGKLLSLVLAVICSVFMACWVNSIFKVVMIATIIGMLYLLSFVILFQSLFSIICKIDVKYNKYMLGSGVSQIIAHTLLWWGFACFGETNNPNNGYLAVLVFVLTTIAYLAAARLLDESSKYHENGRSD